MVVLAFLKFTLSTKLILSAPQLQVQNPIYIYICSLQLSKYYVIRLKIQNVKKFLFNNEVDFFVTYRLSLIPEASPNTRGPSRLILSQRFLVRVGCL